MKNLILLTTALGLLLASCASEKSQVEPPVTYRSLQNLKEGFKNENLLMVPFVMDFHGVLATDQLADAIYGTMNQRKIFIPAKESFARDSGLSIYPLNWVTENEKVSSFLSDHANDVNITFYKQTCAVGMFQKTNLLKDNSSKAAKEAIAKYTEMLVQEGTYSPGLFYYSLSHLKTYWSKDKIKMTRSKALSNHDKFSDQYDRTLNDFEKIETKSDFDKEMAECVKEIKKQNLIYIKNLNSLL